MNKRNWGHWLKGFKEELDGKSIIFTLIGILIAASGLDVVFGNTYLIVVGLFLTMIVVFWSAYQSIPPKLTDPSSVLGQHIDLSKLNNLSEAIPKLSIVGLGQAGKTTLTKKLKLDSSDTARTDGVTAQVFALQTAPLRYIALLDGRGQSYQDQLLLTEVCEHLCIVLDHNSSGTVQSIDRDRLTENEKFLEQIKFSLCEKRTEKPKNIVFLLNKRDLWETAPSSDVSDLRLSFKKIVDSWKNANFAGKVDGMEHSNKETKDVAKVQDFLVACAKAQ